MDDLGDVMGALQAIADAVTRNDTHSYRQAVVRAKDVGCTAEQIRDAYDYRNGLRATPVSFPPST